MCEVCHVWLTWLVSSQEQPFLSCRKGWGAHHSTLSHCSQCPAGQHGCKQGYPAKQAEGQAVDLYAAGATITPIVISDVQYGSSNSEAGYLTVPGTKKFRT